MTTFVARGHGGDAGADPPQGLYHVPSACQSSKSKKKRGQGRSLNLYEAFEKNNKKPLPIKYDRGTMKAVGDNSNTYIRFISNQIAENIPLYHRKWATVPQEMKDFIYERLHHYYDIDSYRNTPIWESVKEAVSADCASRYKSRKHGLKTHFKNRGYDNVEMARGLPPSDIDEDLWSETIDKLFLNEDYMKQSEANAGNRAHHHYEGFHGTESMAAKRYKQEQQTNQQPSLIDGFKDTHYKEGPGWINKVAENHHAMMIAELNARRQEGDTSVDEAEILKKVFGERRGHAKGVGRKLKAVSRYPDFSTQQANSESMVEVKKQLAELQQYNMNLLQALRDHIPNFQPPPMPSFSSTPSQQVEETDNEETSINKD